MQEKIRRIKQEKRKTFSNLLNVNPKRKSFYIQTEGGIQWQNKLSQVLLFSHYVTKGGMRRE